MVTFILIKEYGCFRNKVILIDETFFKRNFEPFCIFLGIIPKTIVCSFQLGQADRFAYKLVNLARCIYYCSIFRFELKIYSL